MNDGEGIEVKLHGPGCWMNWVRRHRKGCWRSQDSLILACQGLLRHPKIPVGKIFLVPLQVCVDLSWFYQLCYLLFSQSHIKCLTFLNLSHLVYKWGWLYITEKSIGGIKWDDVYEKWYSFLQTEQSSMLFCIFPSNYYYAWHPMGIVFLMSHIAQM